MTESPPPLSGAELVQAVQGVTAAIHNHPNAGSGDGAGGPQSVVGESLDAVRKRTGLGLYIHECPACHEIHESVYHFVPWCPEHQETKRECTGCDHEAHAGPILEEPNK